MPQSRSACENICNMSLERKKKRKAATGGVHLCLVVLSARLCNTEHTSVIGIPFLKHLNPPQWGDRRNALQHFFSSLLVKLGFFFIIYFPCISNCGPLLRNFPRALCKLLSLGKSVVSAGRVLKQQPPFWLCHRFLFCPFLNQLCISVASRICS